MENPISSTFMLIVGIIFVTIFPIQHAWRVMDRSCATHVQAVTDDFCDNLRHKGYLDERMLEDYIRRLARTQRIYDIRIIHSREVVWPLQPADPGYSADHPYEVHAELTALPDMLDSIHATGPYARYRMERGDGISIEVMERGGGSGTHFWTVLGGSGENSLMCFRAAGGVTNVDE